MKKQNNDQQQFKELKDLTLLDRFLFDAAMSDPQICQNVLSIIFADSEIPSIRIGISEKTLEPYYDSRAVRLDLLAFDEKDVVYDAEAQQKNEGSRFLRRRSRLYQSHIDVNLLEPGEKNFGKLNDVYVIFIAPFDLFGQKKYMYTFRMMCDESPAMPLDDGAVRIFLNTRGKNDDEVSPELVEFLHYVEKTSQYDKEIKSSRVHKLANQIEMLKNNQEVGVKYMQMWEEIEYEKKKAVMVNLIDLIDAKIQKGFTKEEIAEWMEQDIELINELCDIMDNNPDFTDVEVFECWQEKKWREQD